MGKPTPTQPGAIWAPSPDQAKVLEAALEAGSDRNISKIAEEAGVPRRSIYNWFERDAGFALAWENIWKVTLSRHLPGIVAAMVKKAQGGDVQAGRLVCELLGLLKVRTEVSGPSGGPIPHEIHQHEIKDAGRLGAILHHLDGMGLAKVVVPKLNGNGENGSNGNGH